MGRILIVYLRICRGRAGKTQKDVAEYLGISTQLYSMKENGKRNFSPEELADLIFFLELDPNSIFNMGDNDYETYSYSVYKFFEAKFKEHLKSFNFSRINIDYVSISRKLLGKIEQFAKDENRSRDEMAKTLLEYGIEEYLWQKKLIKTEKVKKRNNLSE